MNSTKFGDFELRPEDGDLGKNADFNSDFIARGLSGTDYARTSSEFVTQPLEPLVLSARSQGENFFRIEVNYRYWTHTWFSLDTWSTQRSAGNFSEKEHFRWNDGKKKLLGRAGRRVPSKFSIYVPGARYVRWLRVGPNGLICDVSPDAAEDDQSRLRLWLSNWAPGPKETADSYKLERPFVDLEKPSEVLQPKPDWYFNQKSHLRT